MVGGDLQAARSILLVVQVQDLRGGGRGGRRKRSGKGRDQGRAAVGVGRRLSPASGPGAARFGPIAAAGGPGAARRALRGRSLPAVWFRNLMAALGRAARRGCRGPAYRPHASCPPPWGALAAAEAGRRRQSSVAEQPGMTGLWRVALTGCATNFMVMADLGLGSGREGVGAARRRDFGGWGPPGQLVPPAQHAQTGAPGPPRAPDHVEAGLTNMGVAPLGCLTRRWMLTPLPAAAPACRHARPWVQALQGQAPPPFCTIRLTISYYSEGRAGSRCLVTNAPAFFCSGGTACSADRCARSLRPVIGGHAARNSRGRAVLTTCHQQLG